MFGTFHLSHCYRPHQNRMKSTLHPEYSFIHFQFWEFGYGGCESTVHKYSLKWVIKAKIKTAWFFVKFNLIIEVLKCSLTEGMSLGTRLRVWWRSFVKVKKKAGREVVWDPNSGSLDKSWDWKRIAFGNRAGKLVKTKCLSFLLPDLGFVVYMFKSRHLFEQCGADFLKA